MEPSRIEKIDSLILDENFRNSIQSLDPHKPVPDQLVRSFSPLSKEEVELARQLIQASIKEVDSIDYSNKDKIWKFIEGATNRFDTEKKLEEPKLLVNRKGPNWKQWMQYAAVLVGLVFLVTWKVLDNFTLNDQVGVSEEVTKTNPSGQKSRITLPDGSIAHLNAESELYYDRNFTGNQRKVYLKKGEAYFEVSKNKEKPFIVIMDNITVTALGTEFDVNTFNEDLKVALVEGSVLVNNTSNNDQLIMEPSEVLDFDPISNRMNITSNNAKELADWKDQILYFNNTSIKEAIGTLARWYAVKISLENTPPPGLTVSGKFNNSSLELVLNNLSYSLDFEFKMNNKDITIKFKK